jgi:hypothetical protein
MSKGTDFSEAVARDVDRVQWFERHFGFTGLIFMYDWSRREWSAIAHRGGAYAEVHVGYLMAVMLPAGSSVEGELIRRLDAALPWAMTTKPVEVEVEDWAKGIIP